MISKHMNTNINDNEKEISLIDAVGLLQQQVKALVKVIKQHDDIISEHQRLLDIITKSDEKF
mgnify:CR=1 FL=1